MKTLLKSFKYAFEGIFYSLKTQRNMRIHFLFVMLMTAAGWYFQIDQGEWLALAITFSLVITSEMFNTAIEKTVDLITEDFNKNAKIAKDVAAGAVLINALIAVAVGYLIFFDRLVEEVMKWL
ncbi:MAG: diacylglycerol kinase family protein [Eubacteriaceae bacterium]|nr:diacylglycerol kinase family protein [Eubacteriaceae bacterium]